METIDLIAQLKQNIVRIQHTDSLDDVKELEFYDFQIINTIFYYGLKHQYSTEGFPEKYNKLIKNEDEDFQDFLNYDVKSYYVYKIALQHDDVFQMVKVYFNDSNSNYKDENCKEDLLISIKILESEGVNLIFDAESFGTIPLFRPKLPR
ncbi:hypothetical protein [Kaistella jeonii]|uniref:Uncharacterized protein n=1 Tax=Kaistella jeonii TaxID=266749 RepID=A0A0C1FNW4_9FLAO|nr:hypothetical protein [Kaistella jeonii]KIA89574.1 hypothetical protein OA86_02760 [Kaistella jeonii]SFB90730.1 hypothetical protein SAMN05421876_103348 [Kaistella jeonii]VEI95779.1 Uncharacterised protein [Kaistella jeonii]